MFETTITDYINLGTYGFVPKDFVPINGPKSVVPCIGNLIDDLLYFFKFHECLKPSVKNNQGEISFVKNNRNLFINIHGNENTGYLSLSGDQVIISMIEFHIDNDKLYSEHEFNDIVYLLYSIQNIFHSYIF